MCSHFSDARFIFIMLVLDTDYWIITLFNGILYGGSGDRFGGVVQVLIALKRERSS